MHDQKRAAEMPPMPDTETHEEFGEHPSRWLITSCGHQTHPYYWSCAICGREPKSEGRDL